MPDVSSPHRALNTCKKTSAMHTLNKKMKHCTAIHLHDLTSVDDFVPLQVTDTVEDPATNFTGMDIPLEEGEKSTWK